MKVTPSKLRDFFDSPELYGSVLLHGSDYGRMSMYTQKILDRINRNSEFVIHKMEFLKANRDPEQLLVSLMTVPMFSKKSLILLTDAKDTLSADLRAAIEGMNMQHCYMIIQARELSGTSTLKGYYSSHKKFAAVGCYKEEDVSFIVADFLAKHGISYRHSTFKLLCTKLKNGSACLQPELEKLLLYLGEQKSLAAEDVQKSLSTDVDPVLDDLCVAITDGNLGDALKHVDTLMQNRLSPILVIRSSLKYFMQLEYLLRTTQSQASIDSALKALQPPVFFRLIPKLKRSAESVSYRTVQVILRRLLEAEIQCKLSDTSQEVVFKYLMCSLTAFVKRAKSKPPQYGYRSYSS
ncbi:DNA polymerase III, delta subunit [Anaplasma centrale str. Israel]|uniref:DNA-directed DNA polymerase n=1 Tax=Anaplasma centrale (strain Israel) TaxID=574556 RepID=D1ATK9_ANACI|nr:DNA polymerase III subunit delta [Anaplasma centrale]ACZ48887.1 DNA polymerase III, delta subunit [Anaplasma centrale str. Israel]